MQDTKTYSNTEKVRDAETRAEMFGFIASMLNRKPGAELVRRLRSAGSEAFAGLIPDGDSSGSVGHGFLDMADFVEETEDYPEDEVEKMLAIDWTRLFRGVSPGYGPPPPYESVYIDQDKSGIEIIQSVRRWYMENGAGIDRRQPNRPDYLGLQIDFLRYLAEQEQKAWDHGYSDEALDFLKKSIQFIAEHITPWAHEFCEQAIGFADTGFYRGLIQITGEIISGANTAEKRYV